MENRSFHFCEAWRQLNEGNSAVHHRRLRVLNITLPFLRSANMHFTVVDRDFSPIEEIERDASLIKHISIQDCPPAVRERLTRGGYSRKEWGTFIIDLARPLDTIWDGVKKSARKLVRRTERECDFFEVESEEQLLEYYRLVRSARKRLGFPSHSWAELLRMWRALHPEHYAVFCVRHKDGTLLAGMAVIHTSELMQEVSAGQSPVARQGNIYANDLLKWGIIRWGQGKGIKRYDLAGVHPEPVPGSKEEGIRAFKEKWGGEFHLVDQYTKIRDDTPWHAAIAGVARRLRTSAGAEGTK